MDWWFGFGFQPLVLVEGKGEATNPNEHVEGSSFIESSAASNCHTSSLFADGCVQSFNQLDPRELFSYLVILPRKRLDIILATRAWDCSQERFAEGFSLRKLRGSFTVCVKQHKLHNMRDLE